MTIHFSQARKTPALFVKCWCFWEASTSKTGSSKSTPLRLKNKYKHPYILVSNTFTEELIELVVTRSKVGSVSCLKSGLCLVGLSSLSLYSKVQSVISLPCTYRSMCVDVAKKRWPVGEEMSRAHVHGATWTTASAQKTKALNNKQGRSWSLSQSCVEHLPSTLKELPLLPDQWLCPLHSGRLLLVGVHCHPTPGWLATGSRCLLSS